MIMNRFSGSQFYELLGVSTAIILVEMEHKDAVERRERRRKRRWSGTAALKTGGKAAVQ